MSNEESKSLIEENVSENPNEPSDEPSSHQPPPNTFDAICNIIKREE